MNITTIITQMTILLLIMIVGFVGAKKNIFNDEVNVYASNILLIIGIPGLIISSVKNGSPFTGNEQFWSVKGDDLFIKETLCLLEDSLSFGRLFVIDVIRTDETKVSRTELGFPGRKCLLCSNHAFVCSRSRTHTVKELLDKACELMKDYFEEKQAKKLSSLSMQALLYEVSATPKPGLRL